MQPHAMGHMSHQPSYYRTCGRTNTDCHLCHMSEPAVRTVWSTRTPQTAHEPHDVIVMTRVSPLLTMTFTAVHGLCPEPPYPVHLPSMKNVRTANGQHSLFAHCIVETVPCSLVVAIFVCMESADNGHAFGGGVGRAELPHGARHHSLPTIMHRSPHHHPHLGHMIAI